MGIGGFSADDINYAARVIFAESSGNAQEDIAMASVIMNRLNNRGFGNQKTLTGVLNVGNGRQFNAINDPNNSQFPMSAKPGQYWQAGSPDCINLTTAIQSMANTVISGPTVPYDSWGAAVVMWASQSVDRYSSTLEYIKVQSRLGHPGLDPVRGG